jgi:hypothetical protein
LLMNRVWREKKEDISDVLWGLLEWKLKLLTVFQPRLCIKMRIPIRPAPFALYHLKIGTGSTIDQLFISFCSYISCTSRYLISPFSPLPHPLLGYFLPHIF